MYDWNDLRIFLAVVRAGSALGAAKTLGINHSTVNRRIQALEHGLGLQLFDRQNRGHKLTDRGRALLAPAELVEKSALDVNSAAERVRRTVSGTVRVTASEAMADLIVIPIVADFQRSNPQIRVEQVATDNRLDIVHGEADVAFRVGSLPDDPRLIAKQLPDAAWSLYCSKSYAATNGRPTDLAEIAEHDIVSFQGALLEHAQSNQIITRSNTVPSTPSLFRADLGVGNLPCLVGDCDQQLIRCFDSPTDISSQFWLLTSQELRNSPHVRAFIDFAVPRILRDKQILSGRETGASG